MTRLFYYTISYLLMQMGGYFLTSLTEISTEAVVAFDLVMGGIWVLSYFRLIESVTKHIKITSAIFYFGHVMHVVSNYFNDGSNTFISFLDDELSHAIIFAAAVLMWSLLIKTPLKLNLNKPGLILLAIIFSLVLSLSTLEAKLALFMLPALTWLCYKAYTNVGAGDIIYFKLVAFLISILIILGWGIYFGGFPEPLTVI